jgi:hypothetical protein
LTPQIGPFRNALTRLLRGQTLSAATADFSKRYATLSADLLDSGSSERPDEELAWDWIERNDARGYILLGDPAARPRKSLMRESPSQP